MYAQTKWQHRGTRFGSLHFCIPEPLGGQRYAYTNVWRKLISLSCCIWNLSHKQMVFDHSMNHVEVINESLLDSSAEIEYSAMPHTLGEWEWPH